MDLVFIVLGALLALIGGALGDAWRDEKTARRGAAQVSSELSLHRIRLVTWRDRVSTKAAVRATERGGSPPPDVLLESQAIPVLVDDYGEPFPALPTAAFEAHRAAFQHLLTEDQEARLHVWYLFVAKPDELPLETYRGLTEHRGGAARGPLEVSRRRVVRGAWEYVRRL